MGALGGVNKSDGYQGAILKAVGAQTMIEIEGS